MAITAGETLSLNSLALATGQSTKSLSAAKGNTTGPISLSSFGIDAVGSISGYTYAVENTSETYTLGFTGAGTNFPRISSRAENFTWSVPSGTTIGLTTNNGSSAVFTVSDRPNTNGTLQSISSNTIRVVFDDGFNDHATNFGANRDKTVYSVDSYDGNSTALCLKSDTLVTLVDGSKVEIGDLEEGSQLKGYSLNGLDESNINMLDWTSSELNPNEVTVNVVNLIFSFADKVYNLNNGEIIATAEHPLVVKDSNNIFRFKNIHNIEIGDSLIKGDGSEVLVQSTEIEEGTVEIVSLDVDGPDTYLANGYITHNKGGNSHTDLGAPGVPTSLAYTAVNGETKNVSWVAGTSSGTNGITAYDLQVDNNSDFSSPALNYTEYSTTSLNIVALATGTYYLRVRCIDHGLKSSWAQLGPFSHTQGVGI